MFSGAAPQAFCLNKRSLSKPPQMVAPGRARTFDGSLLRATNEVPSRFLAADLNDGEVVPDVANDEARAVGISEGTETRDGGRVRRS